MKRTHVFIAVLLAALSTGLAAGLATGGADAADGTTTATTPATDPGTSTDTTTTVGTGTTPTNATTTVDTTTPTATLGTTTNGTVGTLPTTTSDQTTQSSGSGGGQTQPTTTTSAPPVAPCDTTQITCGNNAATQVAIVSQNCNAASGPTLITVQVQTLDGKPVNNYTINPTTTCMNLLAITQIVQQFCINCTLIVLPPPPLPPASAPALPPKPPVRRALYCMPQPVLRSDGTRGTMVDLEYGQPYVDPTYAGATLATYTSRVGYTCPNTGTDDLGSHAPVFTLTVPASFIGQWLNLCIQPTSAAQTTKCRAIRIDNGATVTIPVTSNVAATVTSATGVKGATKTNVNPKSRKQIKKASDAFAADRSTAAKKHVKVTNNKKKVKH